MKILVPVDLIQPIQPIITILNALVPLANADLKLLYVREMLPAFENVVKTSGSFPDDWDREFDAKAKAVMDEAIVQLQPLCKSVTGEVTHGPAAMIIETVARDEHFEMIVLAPRQHSVADRIFSGSVTNKVVHRAAGTLLIARPGSLAGGRLANVMIGFDGSKNACEAITRSLQQFSIAENQPKVTVVHSVDLAEPYKLFGPVAFVSALEQNLLMQGETFLAQAEKILTDAGVKDIELCLIEGDPASELIKMAKDISADLVVIGARGHSTADHLMVGSVSEKVAAHAHCGVAVIKPGTK